MLKLEQWVDELQETAMVDVPIFIFFCTLVKPLTFMEKIMNDRDNLTSNETQEKNDFIENMI